MGGSEVTVSSPTGAFPPLVIHYVETFVVPASVGRFEVANASGGTAILMRAHVRGTEVGDGV